ncbi:MAG: enoyl-CoA hydratase/isomerase family protein [Clostridia bacterium]|nr:enoyl-CoA hydratase/isomerase family protein [Clostridia bacterium]MCL6522689.1 enoyl-CoA hydratase/isomerase family protein [Bacillota bacterium]
MAEAEPLRLEIRQGVALLTLDRPERRNALSSTLWNLLTDFWEQVDRDDRIRVVVLTGAGERAFCAGMDLKEQAELSARGEDLLARVRDPLMRRMLEVRKPVLAAVNGVAAGGGFLLVQNADLRLASEEATFAIAEARVGRGSPWAVPLLGQLPLAVALELAMTGEPLPARRLYELGFVNRLLPPARLLEGALELAERIAANAPLSVLAAKRALREAMSLGLKAGLDRAAELYRVVYASADAVEGPRAFAERRPPRWSAAWRWPGEER